MAASPPQEQEPRRVVHLVPAHTLYPVQPVEREEIVIEVQEEEEGEEGRARR